jgi:predicted alpha/beta-hydrolase family hydrolase
LQIQIINAGQRDEVGAYIKKLQNASTKLRMSGEDKLRRLKDLAGLTTDAHLASLASRFEPTIILRRG